MYRLLTVLILACLVAGGCVTGKATDGPHDVIPSGQVDDSDPRILVIYGNEEFTDKVHVIRKLVDDSGTLAKCSLTLQNISNDTFVVEYQFRWLEQSGMPIMQTPAWSRMTLAPNAVKPILNVAKVPEAKIVEFTIRLPLTGMYQKPEQE